MPRISSFLVSQISQRMDLTSKLQEERIKLSQHIYNNSSVNPASPAMLETMKESGMIVGRKANVSLGQRRVSQEGKIGNETNSSKNIQIETDVLSTNIVDQISGKIEEEKHQMPQTITADQSEMMTYRPEDLSKKDDKRGRFMNELISQRSKSQIPTCTRELNTYDFNILGPSISQSNGVRISG